MVKMCFTAFGNWMRCLPRPHALNNTHSSIPVIIEWPGNHYGGGHVVYLDGHREFVKYPGKFPMTREFIKSLLAIDAEILLK